MGGHHKKFIRKERAKVKLKAKKTVLTKAQNVTDTSFKVKKIVLKEQLKSEIPHEQQLRRKLNIKVCVFRKFIVVVPELMFCASMVLSL
jgi:hypothetical protein